MYMKAVLTKGVVLLISVLVLYSCSPTVGDETSAISLSGPLSMTVSAEGARTILPGSVTPHHYVATLSRSAYTSIVSSFITTTPPTYTFEKVPVGTWSLLVEAFDASVPAKVVGRSVALAVLKDISTQTVSVTVLPIADEGIGGLRLTYSWPAGSVSAHSLVVEPISGGTAIAMGETVTSEPGAATKTVVFENAAVPAGAYRQRMSFTKVDGTILSWPEDARVYANRLSIKSHTFAASDLAEAPLRPLSLAATTADSRQITLSWTLASPAQPVSLYRGQTRIATLAASELQFDDDAANLADADLPAEYSIRTRNDRYGESESRTVAVNWVLFDGQGATTAHAPVRKAVIAPATTVVALPTEPLKTGNLFQGWWTEAGSGGTSFTAATPVTARTTVYAHWMPVHSISFNANGGSGSMSQQVAQEGTTLSLNTKTFTAPYSQDFLGWALTSAGAVAYADKASYTMGGADITLYARWKMPSKGRSWTDVMISDDATVILGVENETNEGFISRDQGANWSIVNCPYVGSMWAMSGDGKVMLNAYGSANYFQISKDSGASWNYIYLRGQVDFSDDITGFDCSDDGKVIVAAVNVGGTYGTMISTDTGATWSAWKQLGSGATIRDVAASGDGTHVAAISDQYIFTGSPANNWIQSSSSWNYSLTSWGGHIEISNSGYSADTPALVASRFRQWNSGGKGYLVGTSNWGWSLVLTPYSEISLYKVAISHDGTKMYGTPRGIPEIANTIHGPDQASLKVSSDTGSTWQDKGGSSFWSGIACSSNGSVVVACTYSINNPGYLDGRIYRSTDSGQTWSILF